MISSRFIVQCLFCILTFFSWVPDSHAESYEKETIRELTGDLRKARESLHEAHLELARMVDRVATLEALLKDHEIEFPPEADSPLLESEKERETRAKLSKAIQKVRELKKRLLKERPGEIAGKVNGVKAAPDKKSAAKSEMSPAGGANILIEYAAGSAVSLTGREKVYRFVEQVLERSPSARFRVEGGADDTEYESSDSVIAENRVRFLVDFLKYKNVSGELFSETDSVSTKGKTGPKKYVRVRVISG
ncbi:MAG: hypothetical protein P1U87_03525 [Verrucomicrobiales bacterium]|nr:hypothetical protein [Verrucomicrobiales bacterium]